MHLKDRKKIKSILCIFLALYLLPVLSSCARYGPAALESGYTDEGLPETSAIDISQDDTVETKARPEETGGGEEDGIDTRNPVKVKGIYLASKPLASGEFVDGLLENLDNTELNAVVIDIKDDYGKITCRMENIASVDELGSVEAAIDDIEGLIKEFKEHDIYLIARIVSMRDPYAGKVRPDWCLHNPDGSIYEDNSGYTWINPYKTEYWDYLLDIGKACAGLGFDEVQFDYIRFCTDRGAADCVYDEEEVKGRDRISIITECVQYLFDNLKKEGVFVSCDVFGTIIRSQVDTRAVGQDYPQLASIVDYMCPMIYPSHYSAGNFGLDMPDLHPYEAILGALGLSRSALNAAVTDGAGQAGVRPWLQAFTATWLGSGNYINYDAEAIRKEIQAVYDAGYDEWILWSASVSYDFGVFLTPEEAEKEYEKILESRAAIPPEETAAETFPAELSEALDGDYLYKEDEEILLEDGPIITYE